VLFENCLNLSFAETWKTVINTETILFLQNIAIIRKIFYYNMLSKFLCMCIKMSEEKDIVSQWQEEMRSSR